MLQLSDIIFEGSTTCVQTMGHSYWEVHYCKGKLETVSVLVQSGSGLQLHAFLVRAGISFSPTCRYISIKYKNLPDANKLISAGQ